MIWTLFSQFLRDLEALGAPLNPRFTQDSTEPFGLLNHVETSKTMSNYYLDLPRSTSTLRDT